MKIYKCDVCKDVIKDGYTFHAAIDDILLDNPKHVDGAYSNFGGNLCEKCYQKIFDKFLSFKGSDK
jgi:hypothetical protein